MTNHINETTWVYVLVQGPGTNEKIIAQKDTQKNITFIPAFMDKESAQQGILHMPKKRGQKYEIQAIIFEDLQRYAAEGPSLIFVLDGDGKIIEKRAPGKGSLQ